MKGCSVRRKLFHAAAIAAAIAAMAAAGPSGLATAAGRPGLGQFTIAPASAPDGAPRGYFMMTVAPGGRSHDVIEFTNGGSTIEKLTVGTTNGLTATNSGSAFGDLSGTCAGVGCWVTGLPATITLPPGTTESVRFLVKVPAGARPMQYLAGITARPVARAQPARGKASGHTGTRVIIVTQVTIGVAITVGKLAALHTKAAVTGVTAARIGSLIRLSVNVRNRGQRFTKGTGSLSCGLGGTARNYPIEMDTVLPGDGAALPVNGTGLHAGTWRCAVKIKDSGGRTDTWTGDVTVPRAGLADTKRIANGDYTVPTSGGIPDWAIGLFVMAGLILFSLWAVLLRRGRHRNLSRPNS